MIRNLAVILLGMLSGLGVVVALGTMPPSSPVTTWRVLPDSHGAIREINIQYAQLFHEAGIETWFDLFNALPADTVVRVVVEKAEEFEFLREDLRLRGVRGNLDLRPVVTGFPITPWAKDRYGTLTDGVRCRIVAPPKGPTPAGRRGNDFRVPEVLASSTASVDFEHLSFHFEGGDFLSDGEHLFVAYNFLARNAPWDVDDRAGLVERISGRLGGTPIVLGDASAEVPDHHIGMYLTPLGDGRLAVADPQLGLVMAREAGVDLGALDVDTDVSRYEPFLNVIRQLERSGFTLVRLPMLLTKQPRVYVTYNNAVLETRRDEKRIYMPVYGIPTLDREASRIYRDAGWSVFPIRVEKMYRHTGSLRCQVGVMVRE